MIFDRTHPNEEYTKQSIKLVGKSFSVLEKIKIGGVGSARLFIAELSPKLKSGQVQFSEIDYANIELRPNGIIIHYTNRLERFAWVIPYYRLVIYDSRFFSVHANGSFLKFLKNKNYDENKKFIDKMITAKNTFLKLGYYDY